MISTAPAVKSSRWDVIQTLQTKRVRFRGVDETEQVLDHAIDLALSGARTEVDAVRLRRDVERNAAHTIRRSQARQYRLTVLYIAQTVHLTTSGDDVVADVDVAEKISDRMTAVCACAVAQATQHSAMAVNFIEHLMDGDTVAEAALAAGMARASAYRFLATLRQPVADARGAKAAA